MELQLIKHKDILFRDLLRVVDIKSISWPYPVESQLKWIIDNVCEDDIHVLLRDKETDIAYLSLSQVSALIDGQQTAFSGVGCVCSRYHGRGAGETLIKKANNYLISCKKKGLLFCKDNLIDFYKKYDWILLPNDRVIFDSPHLDVFTMVYNCDIIGKMEYGDRFF